MNTHHITTSHHLDRIPTKAGFTLIELIVSVALFSIIMTVALGALFMVIDANRQAKGIKLVVNNLNLAMEGISRELRVGSKYCAVANGTGNDCNDFTGSDTVYFTTDRGQEQSFFRYDPADKSITRRIGLDGPEFHLTGSDVSVDSVEFYIRGVGFDDGIQPSVWIVLNGTSRQADQEIDFYLQTLVSQRKLEL